MLYYLKNIYRYERTAGTQISKKAYEFSRNSLKLEMYDKDLLKLDLKNSSFDMITIWHVLEHVQDPEGYVKRISELLCTKGHLIIEVPNFNSWTSKLTGKYWLGLDLDYHMFFFTANSLSRILKKYGFRIKKTQTFSVEYSTFISAQSLISFITRTEHLFFSYIQNGYFKWKISLHTALFILISPICFLLNMLFYFSDNGEVLLFVAQKSD